MSGAGTIKETLTHVLFECWAYNKEQHELRDSRDLMALMGSDKGIKALISFINRMGCLNSTKGEYLVT